MGAKVNVNFSLHYGPVFSVDGTVRWLREFNEFTPDVVPGMGIQFDNLTDDEVDPDPAAEVKPSARNRLVRAAGDRSSRHPRGITR